MDYRFSLTPRLVLLGSLSLLVLLLMIFLLGVQLGRWLAPVPAAPAAPAAAAPLPSAAAPSAAPAGAPRQEARP